MDENKTEALEEWTEEQTKEFEEWVWKVAANRYFKFSIWASGVNLSGGLPSGKIDTSYKAWLEMQKKRYIKYGYI